MAHPTVVDWFKHSHIGIFMRDGKTISVTVEQAVGIVLDATPVLSTEMVSLNESPGRVIALDCIADVDIPPFNNSAMDGFAVRSVDTAGDNGIVVLTVVGELQAARIERMPSVTVGTAVRIMTGAPLPEGADAVIPVEDTDEDIEAGTVTLQCSVRRNENVRFAGEDIKAGQRVILRGTKINSAAAGLLASLNRSEVPVHCMPRVAIISTGNEIVEVGEALAPGQIRNSNAVTIRSEVARYGGIPEYLGIAPDSRRVMKELFSRALDHDMVITTGGVSMGKYDLVKEVLADLGVDFLFASVRMKPGRPTVFGRRGSTPVFALPGNPVSTMVSFMQFIRPALLKMGGAQNLKKPELKAYIDGTLSKKPGRREFLRGYYSVREGILKVSMTGPQGSGILTSMHQANCLIVLPEDSDGVNDGDQVIIQLIHHEEID